MWPRLCAVAAADSTDAIVVVSRMKEMRSKDALYGEGRVRQDGRHIHNMNMNLFQVEVPAESKGPWV